MSLVGLLLALVLYIPFKLLYLYKRLRIWNLGRKRGKVVVIGAGISGLSSGVYAAWNNFDVDVFEHHSSPGGQCVVWKRKGFGIDGCLHWTFAGNNLPFYYEAGVVSSEKDMRFLESWATVIDEETGTRISMTRDLDKLKADLLGICQGDQDKKLVEHFIGKIVELKSSGGFPPTVGPDELLTWVEKKYFEFAHCRGNTYWTNRLLMVTSVADYIKDVKSPTLRKFFLSLFTSTNPIMFIMMVLAQLSAGIAWKMASGGSQKYVDNIEKRLKHFGGKVHYNCGVAKVVVEDGKVKGVQLENGTFHQADYVISSGDLRGLIDNLLEGKYFDEKIEDIFKNIEIFPPVVHTAFCLSKVPESLTPQSDGFKLILEDPLPPVFAEKVVEIRTWRHHNDPENIPDGKCIIKVNVYTSMEYGWESFNGERYEQEKTELESFIWKRIIQKYFQVAKEDVVFVDMATPMTRIRYTRAYKSCYEGFCMPSSGKYLRSGPPASVAGIKNLYLAGNWASFGGGVMQGIKTARDAVDRMCRSNSLAFCPPPLHV